MTYKTGIKCVKCGRDTEWDDDMGNDPLCMICWDQNSEVDNELAAKKRKYRIEHKDELAANQRKYRIEHKDELAALRST